MFCVVLYLVLVNVVYSNNNNYNNNKNNNNNCFEGCQTLSWCNENVSAVGRWWTLPSNHDVNTSTFNSQQCLQTGLSAPRVIDGVSLKKLANQSWMRSDSIITKGGSAYWGGSANSGEWTYWCRFLSCHVILCRRGRAIFSNCSMCLRIWNSTTDWRWCLTIRSQAMTRVGLPRKTGWCIILTRSKRYRRTCLNRGGSQWWWLVLLMPITQDVCQ